MRFYELSRTCPSRKIAAQSVTRFSFLLCVASLLFGCATYKRVGLDPVQAKQIEKTLESAGLNFSQELEQTFMEEYIRCTAV